ncbi:filamentous hemagglutinin N-terminal domain-containing protein, partial [Acetobacter fabarum]|uniref:beta strand repeat-containing protein n=1 Tax=Acetobacter fabarum TaxID=483199 RepID=UPI00312B5151
MTLTIRIVLFGVTALTPVVAWAQALPTGGSYVAGSGSINTAGATTTINQSSARGVINWQGFSIGAGGAVQFNNASGATLNRVTGNQLSSIQGHLGATGTVFLINPNGVVVGPGGTVVTGGSFVASTRDTSNSAFMKGGNVALSGKSSGTVTNAGKITSTGGNVVLVGAAVSNSGEINAAGGTAALVAGNQVVLSEADGPAGIYVVADSKAKGNVTNTGRIKAAAATLASAGGNVYALAGNREGLVQATGTTTINGQVWLSAPHGTVTVDSTTLSASNADGSGGLIHTNGESISLGGKSVLNASATRDGRKGGQILVGADHTGGANLARRTTVASGATLKATGKGNGAGGTIETSAHTLTIGAATIRAGLGGSWLLDPDDLTIDSAAASTINETLNSGSSVTEQTSASTTLGYGNSAQGNGDILLNAALSWNSTASLILSAYHSITLNAGITVGGAGQLTLTTNNNINGSSAGDGAVNFGTGSAISFTNVAAGPALTIDGSAYTLLSSANQLSGVSLFGDYALATDLDATGLGTLTAAPISSFSGIFNGLGHTISNLTIHGDSTQQYIGLFGQNYGTIENLGLINANLTNSFYKGETGAIAGENNNLIQNVYATVNIAGLNATSNFIGGITGFNAATLAYVYSHGQIASAPGNIGGVAGYNNGSITNVFSSVDIPVTNNNVTGGYVGGIIGGNDSAGSLSNSYSTGTISVGASSFIGGAVGFNNGDVADVYATGNVTGGNRSYVGGFVGQGNTGNITDAYAKGTVTGSADAIIGAFSGKIVSGNYTDAYYDTTIAHSVPAVGQGSSANITGLTTEQWRSNGPGTTNSPYAFVNPSIWTTGSPYPVLSSLPYVTITASGAQVYGSSSVTNATISTAINQNGQDISSAILPSAITWQSNATPQSTVNSGLYGLWGKTSGFDMYQVTYAYNNSNLSITPAALSITANHQTGTYGQSPTLGNSAFTATGLLNSDTISGISLATNATSTSSVGDYAITASNATGSGLGNYAISYSAGAYTITPAALSITANHQAGTYGQSPTLGNSAFTATGLLNSDTISGISLATNATSTS